MTTPDGLLLVDKGAGMTSHDVVDLARRALGTRRIGHAGTLDPFATGLLVLLVGHATRLASYLEAEPKVYEASIRFGAEMDTDDVTGEVTRDAVVPTEETMRRALPSLTGALQQRPPSYSAKQVDGVRAHAAARRGKALELAAVAVTVHAWDDVSVDGAELRATITCSGGTYIRALARDLGRATNSAAHCATLRRTRAGAFHVGDAVPASELPERGTAAVRPALGGLARSIVREAVSDDDVRRIRNGQRVAARTPGERAALVASDGVLLGLADRRGDEWQPTVVLANG